MIVPPDQGGIAFTESTDGDLRHDLSARAVVAKRLAISENWAYLDQVHGSTVVRVQEAGNAGEGDAIWTSAAGVPVAVFTADCFAVALLGQGAVGVAHAGWRGARKGVVAELRSEMAASGHAPDRAAVGPGIGPCCFEVGPEVANEFGDKIASTTWGTTSVDLPAVVSAQLSGLETWSTGSCTMHGSGWFSHRRDQTKNRLAAVSWL